MDENTYTITLADGTEIPNVKKNGDNYVVNGVVDTSVFEDNCSPLTITDGEETTVYEYAAFVQAQKHGNETWLVFRELTPSEFRDIKVRADIDFIAMMTDVDLEVE